MAQFADHYDPATGTAFQKLAQILPPAVAEHLVSTIDVLASRRRDEAETNHLRALAKAWAERRIVELTLSSSQSVASLARQHGVNANQVFYWRKLYHAGQLGGESAADASGVRLKGDVPWRAPLR